MRVYERSFTYDRRGNRTSMTDHVAGETTTYTYDAASQLILEESPAGTTTYTYDAAGRCTRQETPSTITDFEYDALGRVTIVEPVSGPVTFTYNGSGQRVKKETPTATTRYLYDFRHLLAEMDGAGDTESLYTYAENEYGDLVSQYDEVEDESSYFHYDAQWSTNALADAAGDATDRWQYSAFGLADQTQGTNATPHTFVGKQGYYHDSELSLYLLGLSGNPTHAGGRFYDPATGRFLTPDPLGPDTDALKNPYRYVGNNPVNGIDPSGLDLLGPDGKPLHSSNSSFEEPVSASESPKSSDHFVTLDFLFGVRAAQAFGITRIKKYKFILLEVENDCPRSNCSARMATKLPLVPPKPIPNLISFIPPPTELASGSLLTADIELPLGFDRAFSNSRPSWISLVQAATFRPASQVGFDFTLQPIERAPHNIAAKKGAVLIALELLAEPFHMLGEWQGGMVEDLGYATGTDSGAAIGGFFGHLVRTSNEAVASTINYPQQLRETVATVEYYDGYAQRNGYMVAVGHGVGTTDYVEAYYGIDIDEMRLLSSREAEDKVWSGTQKAAVTISIIADAGAVVYTRGLATTRLTGVLDELDAGVPAKPVGNLGHSLNVSVPRATGSAASPVTGSQWYEALSARYGAENVTWSRVPAYTGGKTQGVLATSVGDIDLLSGYVGPSAAMGRGQVPGMNNHLRAHVEAHTASAMRQLQLNEATLYLNQMPCVNLRGGCEAMLPRMLGEGRQLRVVVPGQLDRIYIGVAP